MQGNMLTTGKTHLAHTLVSKYAGQVSGVNTCDDQALVVLGKAWQSMQGEVIGLRQGQAIGFHRRDACALQAVDQASQVALIGIREVGPIRKIETDLDS